MDIIWQLMKIYRDLEFWHHKKMSLEDSWIYHKKMLTEKNIITYVKDGELKGYVEYWLVTKEQLERILFDNFFVFDEDIRHGDICYVANMWVHDRESFKYLKNNFMKFMGDVKFFAGERNKIKDNVLVTTFKYHKNIKRN